MLLQSRSEALIPYTTNGYLLYISDRLEVKKKIWAVSDERSNVCTRRNYIALPSISKNTLQGALMEIEGVRVFLTISGIELFHADFLGFC
jgi:hypothetical protein